MHSRAGWPERCLNKMDRALGRDAATRSAKLWSDRIATEKPESLWTGAPLVVVPAARSSSQGRGGSRSLLGPANGVGSEVLSVVPPGGSSEVVCSERLRIDWNNRRALVGITIC
jgi:hypothetical protein